MKTIGFFIFLSSFFIAFAWLQIATSTRRRISSRIDEFTSVTSEKTQSKKFRASKLHSKNGIGRQIQLIFDQMQNSLVRAEIDVKAQDFAMRWTFISACGGVISFLVRGIVTAILYIGFSFFGTFLYIKLRENRRLHRFEESLHDMLTITANSLRAGYSFMQAIQVVSEDMSGPIQEELSRVLAEMNVGVPLEDAFKATAARMNSSDFNLIVTAILIQRQVGGNLAEVLDQIAETIRERVQLKREVKALTTQGRMSALIFMLLPIGLGAMMYMMAPDYVSVLFETTVGKFMLVVALIMQLFGFIIIRKMVNIDL